YNSFIKATLNEEVSGNLNPIRPIQKLKMQVRSLLSSSLISISNVQTAYF
ncbi:hypothetical protein OOU_Y34scaffold00956g1, partial [Pyricularia oryzae Y34]